MIREDMLGIRTTWGKIVLTALLLAVLGAQLIRFRESVREGMFERSGVGRKDFVSFWAGAQLFARGENLYDARLSDVAQQAAGMAPGSTMPAFAPPWTFVLLGPIFALRLPDAILAWAVANLMLLFLASALSVAILRNAPVAREIKLWSLGAVLFFPAWENIEFGQLALMTTFGITGAVWAYQRKRDALAGILLTFALTKPHLVFLVLCALGVCALKERRFKFIISSVSAFAALAIVAELRFPGIFSLWSGASASPFAWKGASLVTPIRDFAARWSNNYPVWPSIVIPIVAIAAVSGAVIVRKFWDWCLAFPVLTCLSLLLTPYCWNFDQSLLLSMFLSAILFLISSWRFSQRRLLTWIVIFVFVGLQVLRVLSRTTLTDQESFYWYPLAMLLVWMLSYRIAKPDPALV